MSLSVQTQSADPKIWGPVLWKFLHIMAHNYPENPNPQTKASSRQFFFSLRHLLPCETCRIHYNELIAKRQPETDSAELLQEWILWLHNEVSARTNPTSQPWTRSQLIESLKNISQHQQSDQTQIASLSSKSQHTTTQSSISYSPRSKDTNLSLHLAQQMHKRLSATRQLSIVKPEIQVATQEKQQTNIQPISLIRQQGTENSRSFHSGYGMRKDSHNNNNLHLKKDITHTPYNTYNRKSMLPRNARFINPQRKAKFIMTQRGKAIYSSQSINVNSATCANSTSKNDNSGTKKACGCKNQ